MGRRNVRENIHYTVVNDAKEETEKGKETTNREQRKGDELINKNK